MKTATCRYNGRPWSFQAHIALISWFVAPVFHHPT